MDMVQEDGSGEVVRLEVAQAALRDHFLGWQCRLRQLAMRQGEGRPSAGMRPTVSLHDRPEALGAVTVLILKRDPEEATAQFRHMVRKTHDPAERRDGALKHLQSAYYQRPQEFSDVMTALFGPGSGLARQLTASAACRLDFEQYNQSYRIPCAVHDLTEAQDAYQATYWHNSLFNPNLPAGIQILAFTPDWSRADAEPEVG